jgi:uncharacterized membrane protein
MKFIQNPAHFTTQPSGWSYLYRLSSKLKPEVVFLYFSLVFGLSLLVTIPPFQAPDEQHHFFRAYQVSEGIMVGEHFRVEYLPKSLKYAWEMTNGGVSGYPTRKLTAGAILSALQIPLDPDDKSLIASFAAPYSPHYYFPQALGLLVGRKLGLGPLPLLYLGRLCTLMFCVSVLYWSIKKTPLLKWVFCLIAATPLNLALAASCSQDGVINSLAFLFTASVLDLAFSPDKEFTARSVWFPAILGALLAPAKGGAYAPMLAFFFLVPVRKAASFRSYFGLIVLAAIPALVALGSWTIVSHHQLFPILDPAPADIRGTTATSLLWGIGEEPLQYLWLIAKTTSKFYRLYLAHFVGGLGWQDTLPPIPVVVSYLAVVFSAAIAGDPVEKGPTVTGKIVVSLMLFFIYVYILTTQYCAFTPRHSDVIMGFNARYLIPMSPGLFLLFYNRRQIFGPRFIAVLPLVIVSLMLLVVPTTLLTVVNRYYGGEQATWRMSLDLRPAPFCELPLKDTSASDFSQTFVCPANGLTGVSVFIVGSEPLPGTTITGYRLILKDSVSGEVMRDVAIQPFVTRYRLQLEVLFDPILDSRNKKYSFTVFPSDRAGKIPMVIGLGEPRAYPEGETTVHGVKTDRSIAFGLIFRSSSSFMK